MKRMTEYKRDYITQMKIQCVPGGMTYSACRIAEDALADLETFFTKYEERKEEPEKSFQQQLRESVKREVKEKIMTPFQNGSIVQSIADRIYNRVLTMLNLPKED